SVTLGVALRLGIPVPVGTSLGDTIDLLPGALGAALIGVGFALTSYVRLVLAPLVALAAGLVFALFWLVQPVFSQPGLAPAIGGAAAGVIGYLVYRWLKVPEAVFMMAGIIGLIPGL